MKKIFIYLFRFILLLILSAILMLYFIGELTKFIISYIVNSINKLGQIIKIELSKLKFNSFKVEELKIIAIEAKTNGRYLKFTMINNKLYDHYNLFKSVYLTLFNNEEFIKFGNKKVIITNGVIGGTEFTLHHNILIDNNFTYLDFYNLIKDIIQEHYEQGYPVHTLELI